MEGDQQTHREAVEKVAQALQSFFTAGAEGNSGELASKLMQLYILISIIPKIRNISYRVSRGKGCDFGPVHPVGAACRCP